MYEEVNGQAVIFGKKCIRKHFGRDEYLLIQFRAMNVNARSPGFYI